MSSDSRRKVTVIGAGNVGATTAQRISEAGLADVVLVMRRGRVIARLQHAGLSAERVALLMAGGPVP